MEITLNLKFFGINLTFQIAKNRGQSIAVNRRIFAEAIDKISPKNIKDYNLKESETKRLYSLGIQDSQKGDLIIDNGHKLVDDEESESFKKWKMEIKRDFSDWIDELTTPAEIEPLNDEPDIYSFFKELCVLTTEVRKGNRKSNDLSLRFEDKLTGFTKTINDLKDHLDRLDAEKNRASTINSKQLIMSLVEVSDRMSRLERAFVSPPKKGLFGNAIKWEKAWNNLKNGFSIIISHMENLLKKEGIIKISTVGNKFDPVKMIAVATESTTEMPPNTVIEEISRGYIFNENVLKFAEVKVSTRKEQ